MLRDACDLFPPWWQSRRTLTGSNPITARPVQQHQISFPTDAFQVAPWTQNSHLPELHSFPGAPRSSCRCSKMLEQIIYTAVSDTHSFHSDQCTQQQDQCSFLTDTSCKPAHRSSPLPPQFSMAPTPVWSEMLERIICTAVAANPITQQDQCSAVFY